MARGARPRAPQGPASPKGEPKPGGPTSPEGELKSGQSKARWYADGLRFSCQPNCGACCTNHGKYTYVYLEGDDLERLSNCLRLSPEEFKRRYTSLDDDYLVLRMDEPDCPFLDGTRCSVYPARPTQCRTFPFWKENLRSRAAWERLRDFCPGIGQGEKHTLLAIGRQLSLRGQE